MPGRSEDHVFLGLGGNMGDPAAAMASALRLLDRDGETDVLGVSSIYRTPPWGKVDQPDFLNAAAQLRTNRTPRALLELCLDIERILKRERRERWGPRPIDLDILMFGALEVNEPDLTIPHPRLAERAFALLPLAELAPDLSLGGKTLSALIDGLDASGIERLESGRDWWRG